MRSSLFDSLGLRSAMQHAEKRECVTIYTFRTSVHPSGPLRGASAPLFRHNLTENGQKILYFSNKCYLKKKLLFYTLIDHIFSF